MKRMLGLVTLTVALVSCAGGPSRDQDLVRRALDALGGADSMQRIKTVSIRGTVKHWEPEQSDVPGGEMRFAADSKYELTGDYTTRSARTDWEKNFAYPSPRTFKFSEIVTPDAGYVIGIDSNGRNAQNLAAKPPAHSMSGARLATTQREFRRSSHTLILEMHNNLQRVSSTGNIVVDGVSYPAVRYDGGDTTFIVAFDPNTGLPARVRTLDYDNIWGDVNFDLTFADWRDMGGMKIAATQKHELNGRVIIETRIQDVRTNVTIPAGLLDIPADVKATASRPATGAIPYQWVLRRQFIGTYMDSDHISFDTRASKGLRLQELAPGVQHQVGGTHHSMLVEMSDHLIVFDAPVDDSQSNWVIAEAKAKYPGKPIRYLVLTHHHMDHAGGLRAYVAEGATLVVGQGAGAHFRRVLAAPFSRNPHLKQRDLSPAQIVEVPERYVMTDGKRRVSAHVVDNPHSKAYLIGYVEDARIGYVTDIWSPGVGTLPGKITTPLAALVNATRRAGIQPLRFAGGHGSTADFAPVVGLADK